MTRDLTGYGETPPAANWPGGARTAVQFVINYEEGAENSILNGDAGSEAFLSEMVGATSHVGARAMAMESLYEYGSRAGFWRLHRLFTSRQIPVTVFGVARAMEMNPQAVEAMLKADWEIASHGLRWIDYQNVPEATEREHIEAAIALHTKLTGTRPLGWYQGRTSPNTARLVAQESGFLAEAGGRAVGSIFSTRLDATTGQNALIQVEAFRQLADVTGLVMTKLDGTAKGGVLVALADKFGLPIHAIGVGEQIDDLAPFDPEDFANALTGLEA